MSRGDKLLRRVEKWLIPWFSREEHEAEVKRVEANRLRSIAARIDAERVRKIYLERQLGRR